MLKENDTWNTFLWIQGHLYVSTLFMYLLKSSHSPHRHDAHILGSNGSVRAGRTGFSHLRHTLASVCPSVKWRDHYHSWITRGVPGFSWLCCLATGHNCGWLGMTMGDLACLPRPQFPHFQKGNDKTYLGGLYSTFL